MIYRESPFADVFLCQKAHIAYQKLQVSQDLLVGITYKDAMTISSKILKILNS